MPADPVKLAELDEAYKRAQINYEEAVNTAILADNARARAHDALHEARTAYLEERHR